MASKSASVAPGGGATAPTRGLAPVRWGVLGFGDVARRAFMPALAASSAGRLVAVASERGDPRELSEELPAARVHSGLDAYAGLLRSDDIDAVYVAVPNHLHARLTKAAADTGKHVLCEKPLATSAHEAVRVAEYCAAKSVVLMEAMMARFNPQHDRVRELIAAGAVGRPRLFRASFTVALGDPADDVRFLPELGAGALFDVGVYPISVARWIFGAEPEEVQVVSQNMPGTDSDEVSGVLLRFPGERLAVIDCGLTMEPRNTYEVVGSEGGISVARPFASPPFVPVEPALELRITRSCDITIERFEDVDQYREEVEAFHRVVRGELSHPYPPRESIKTARVIDACRARAHCAVAVALAPSS